MKANHSAIEADSLESLCELLELARRFAAELPPSMHPSHIELIEALATSRLCALRLAAERAPAKKRALRRA